MEYQSLAAMFLSQAERYGNKVLYRFVQGGQWRSLTWSDARAQIREIALGLTALGVGRGDMAEFFCGLGILIPEGYGLTETSTVSHVNRPDNYKFGTVGLPLDGTECRISSDGESEPFG
jgi:long-subunit acyl-CoA synthetase (AMP-forming)